MIRKKPNRLLLKENKSGKRLAKYTSFVELKKQFPREIISEIFSSFKQQGSFRIKRQIGDFSLTIRKTENKNSFSNNSARYFVQIKSKSGTQQFFIKEVNSNKDKAYNPNFLMGTTGVNEIIALNFTKKFLIKKPVLISGYKLETIQAHFAYEDIVSHRSYILYDFTALMTVKAAKEKGFVSKDFEQEISSKLKELKEKINENLKEKNHQSLHLKKNNKIDDILIRNLFIDFKNKKLYLSDPWLKQTN